MTIKKKSTVVIPNSIPGVGNPAWTWAIRLRFIFAATYCKNNYLPRFVRYNKNEICFLFLSH